jgi:hypothetical protein
MVALLLVGWAAMGGTCSETNLAEGRAAFHRAVERCNCCLEQIAWMDYYRNNWGQSQNNGVPYGPGRVNYINYPPVFVSPTLQWAVPNSCLNGPPSLGSGYQAYPQYYGLPIQ